MKLMRECHICTKLFDMAEARMGIAIERIKNCYICFECMKRFTEEKLFKYIISKVMIQHADEIKTLDDSLHDQLLILDRMHKRIDALEKRQKRKVHFK